MLSLVGPADLVAPLVCWTRLAHILPERYRGQTDLHSFAETGRSWHSLLPPAVLCCACCWPQPGLHLGTLPPLTPCCACWCLALPRSFLDDPESVAFDLIVVYYGTNASFACPQCLHVFRFQGPK